MLSGTSKPLHPRSPCSSQDTVGAVFRFPLVCSPQPSEAPECRRASPSLREAKSPVPGGRAGRTLNVIPEAAPDFVDEETEPEEGLTVPKTGQEKPERAWGSRAN